MNVPYLGSSIEEMGNGLSQYFPEGSDEFETVMAEWKGWLKWKPAERKPKKDPEGNTVLQEQPEYRNSFSIRMDDEIGEIGFKKEVVFSGEVRKRWYERRHGIIRDSAEKYQLTV